TDRSRWISNTWSETSTGVILLMRDLLVRKSNQFQSLKIVLDRDRLAFFSLNFKPNLKRLFQILECRFPGISPTIAPRQSRYLRVVAVLVGFNNYSIDEGCRSNWRGVAGVIFCFMRRSPCHSYLYTITFDSLA